MDFTEAWDFGDVTFIVEEKRIYVNKAVLAMSSEVFKAMFNSEFREKKMTDIPLPDKRFDDFLQLMQILHPQVNKCVDETNVECILSLAQEYLIMCILKDCEKYLLTQPPSIHNLVLADKFSLSELREICIQYICSVPYNKLEQDAEFKLLEKETICHVLMNKMQLYEGKDPLKDVIYKLTADPPSIKNLFLAEKYDVPGVSEKCLKYLRDTPLKELKQEEGFEDLKVGTLNEVLTHKYETLYGAVSKIASLGTENRHVCIICKSYRGTYANCSECKRYMCTSGNHHEKGTGRDCIYCKAYKCDEMCEVVKRY